MASVEKQLLGTETIQALRAKGVQSIICGLSANDMEEEFRKAGANFVMSKPFPCQRDALREEFRRMLHDHASMQRGTEQSKHMMVPITEEITIGMKARLA